jgi:formylglycine-generating enzyme required for sulfatase activity
LYDVIGNLWEWCLDWSIAAGTAYTGGQDGVCVVSGASSRFLRGSGWNDALNTCSLGYRSGSNPNSLSAGYSFRLAVVP